MSNSDITCPTVSVIMPAYNHEKYVGLAIESVLGQTYTDFELIIVNDGSTDKTAEVIKRYTDSRIRYYEQKNGDAYNAINSGLSKATGEYLTIINSDDEFHLNRLDRLVSVINDTGADLIFTDLTVIDAGSNVIENDFHPLLVAHKRLKDYFLQCNSLIQTLFVGNIAFSTSNLFFKRHVYKQIGEFRSLRYAHDYDYILRVMEKFESTCIYLQENLLSYRVHYKNTVKENPVGVDIETIRLLIEHLPKFMSCQRDRGIIEAVTGNFSGMHYIMLDADMQMKRVRDTLSWKITAPLRLFGEKLGVSPPHQASAFDRMMQTLSSLFKNVARNAYTSGTKRNS